MCTFANSRLCLDSQLSPQKLTFGIGFNFSTYTKVINTFE